VTRVEELTTLCQALLSHRGEASGARLAADVDRMYRSLDDIEIEAFLDRLATKFSPDLVAVRAAVDRFQQDSSLTSLLRLQAVVESPRQELFRRWNFTKGGTATLLQMRRRLLTTLKAHPERAGLDADLLHLFRSWFNRGFLVLQRIDWRTPAVILERLIEYEAVHQIQGWRDLRRRLENDRRCYAFFHPALPDEPLIFIEVALTHGMSARVQPLLDVRAPVGDPAKADCAMFYSITNCQEGLRGISFGNQLIKQVAEDLKHEFPHLRRFATLSPIPGFRRWLESNAAPALLARIADPAWHLGEIPEALQDELLHLCAYYLARARQDDGEPLDPVARFHLANGASLERLNFLGDTSDSGMARSAGLMVNYVYWLAELEKNHERYFRERVVNASPVVERLARECPLPGQDAA